MGWRQDELFEMASEGDIARTKYLLSKYIDMLTLMEDFEQYEKDLAQVAVDGEVARRIDGEARHADKTANAVILTEKQKWVYEQYKNYTQMLDRAVRLIRDGDARKAVEYRYLKGKSRKETVHDIRGLSESTIDRKLDIGIETMANTLKILGFFDKGIEC